MDNYVWICSTETYRERNYYMHKPTGFESYAGQRQEEQEKEEALTVMYYQCTEKLSTKQLVLLAKNQVVLF